MTNEQITATLTTLDRAMTSAGRPTISTSACTDPGCRTCCASRPAAGKRGAR